MSTILSTKILNVSQQELLLNAGINFVHYDAIQIELLDIEISEAYDYILFTSQNAVNAYLAKYGNFQNQPAKILCVGSKTERLLLDKGGYVQYTAESAAQLAQYIIEERPAHSFLYLTGNIRRDELPNSLNAARVAFNEVIAYNTQLWPKFFKREFEAVLFFSPSGVRSFVAKNQFGPQMAFCIGETTAAEVKLYTDNYIIANKPTVENVLVQAINYFRTI